MNISRRKRYFKLAMAALYMLAIASMWQNLSQQEMQTRAGKRYESLPIQNKLKGMERKAASAEWFIAQRTYGLGYIPQDAEIRAVEDMRTRMIPELQAQQRLQKSAAAQLHWEFRGPGNLGGRLRGLLVHPTDPNILYAGSVSGGVWKSTNAGATWSPTMNDLITLNIGALAMKPGDPNTIYAGTGEGYLTVDAQPGRGLLKTTDGGQIWKRIHVAQGLDSPYIMSLAVSPAAPNVVYAAGRKALPRFPVPSQTTPDPGINAVFKSTDSGETWQDVTTGKGIEHDPQEDRDDFPTDVEVSAADANVLYATFGVFGGAIWKSQNGGQTWARLTNGLPDHRQPNQGYGRIELAMAPSDPNILYASYTYRNKAGDNSPLADQAMLGLWKTANAGQSWTQMTTPLTGNKRNIEDNNTTALGSQGGYANAIIVHPTDPNTLFLGGLDIYKSTDGGKTWSQVSMWIEPGDAENPENLPYVHADQQVFAFDRSTNPPTLYNGNDGGVARSRDLGATWETLNNNLGVTQFYFFATHPTSDQIMLGGSQDNGSPVLINGGVNEWGHYTTGDGGPAWFDFNDPATAYYSGYALKMYRGSFDYARRHIAQLDYIGFINGSNGITKEDVDGADFFAPYEMSPNNPNVLVLGTDRLLKTTNRGDSWRALSARFGESITSVAVAEGNDNILWFGFSGKVFKTEDGGASYTEVTGNNLPKRFLTDIEFDPTNTRTIYLTYSGYGTPHVFKSTDAGASWRDVTNNLPDAPANAIQVHPQQPNTLLLGMDIGMFMSEDGGQTWQPANNNFPTAQVVAIVLNTRLNRIYAATHGRGVYSAPLSDNSAAVLQVHASEIQIKIKPGQTGSGSFTIENTGGAALNFNLTTSGGQANAAAGSAMGTKAKLPHGRAPLETILSAPSRSISFRRPALPTPPGGPGNLVQNEHYARAEKDPYRMTTAEKATSSGKIQASLAPAFALAQPSSLQGNDVLILDDGNNTPDDFIGEGPNSLFDFYWMNRFDLAQDFQLEAFRVYLRTESAFANPLDLAVLDDKLQDLVRGSLNMALSQNGDWYTIQLTTPLRFQAGQTFYIEVGTSAAIAFPAGADKKAQVPNKSYHFNWIAGQYESLGTVAEFENGAYLIRAVGTKSGGGNQPPVAKAVLSALQAKVNETILFDASQSTDPDGQITQYRWDFGDGRTSEQKLDTHAYTQPGNYTAKLTVTDNQGATGQTTGQVTITAGGLNRLAANPASGTIAPGSSQDITVTFDAQGLAEGNYQGVVSITSNGGNRTLPVRIQVSNSTPTQVELAYDNGTPTSAVAWPGAGQGSAVRFTPPQLPARLIDARIFITGIEQGNKHKLRVLADDNGKPGRTIYLSEVFTFPNPGGILYDLSAANISVRGDFYIMIDYDGVNKPQFGVEAEAPIAKRSWDFDGTNWSLNEAEDYIIRAMVEIGTTGVDDRSNGNNTPKSFELVQNYPNPFNPETTIKYQLPKQAQVELAVYDLTGRRVATLESGMKTTGVHEARWNGRDQAGRAVASGVYFYRMQATPLHGQSWVMTKKMTLMK